MSLFTSDQIKSLDIISPFGPFCDVTPKESITTFALDFIGPTGPFIAFAPTSVAPTFDATKMFMIF